MQRITSFIWKEVEQAGGEMTRAKPKINPHRSRGDRNLVGCIVIKNFLTPMQFVLINSKFELINF